MTTENNISTMMFHPSGAVFKSKPKRSNDEEKNTSHIVENKNDDEEIKKLALELKTRQITNLILKSTLIEKVSNNQQNDSPNNSSCGSNNNDLIKPPISNSTPILHGLLKMQDTSLYASSIFLKLNNCNNSHDNESSSNSPQLDSPATLEYNDQILKSFDSNINSNQTANNQNCEEDRNERSLSSSVSSLSSMSPSSLRQNHSIATINSSPKTTITTAATTTTTTPIVSSSNNSNSGYSSPVSHKVANQNEKSEEHDECLNETASPPTIDNTEIINENIDLNSNASASSSTSTDNLIINKKRKRSSSSL
jgi:hypothetical protein